MITKQDLLVSMRTYKLDQLIDNDNSIVTVAIQEALGIMRNTLEGPGYDTNIILSATGNARDQQILGYLRYIVLYKLYERVPDEQVPDRIVKNYNDTLDMIKRIADGRMPLSLPKKSNENGTPKTKFRWGSDRKRNQY